MRRVMIAWLVSPMLAANAQFIGPVPPATPGEPEYVPKAAPKVEPVEIEPPAPSIVKRDAEGRLQPIDGTPEEAAVAAYGFTPERAALIARSRAARKLDIDRFVARNAHKVLLAEAMREQVTAANDFNTLFAARDAVASLKQERLLDRLQRDGAITPQQRVRLDETVRTYEVARKEQIEKDAKGDPTRQAIVNLRYTYADAMREQFESLDRLVAEVSGNSSRYLDRDRLGDDQQTAFDRLVEAKEPGERRLALRTLFNLLTEEQREELLPKLAEGFVDARP